MYVEDREQRASRNVTTKRRKVPRVLESVAVLGPRILVNEVIPILIGERWSAGAATM